MPDRGIVRRAVLAVPAAFAIGINSSAYGEEVSPSSRRDDTSAALNAYCGVYRLTPDHAVGIDRFITDFGQNVLLFADYKTSLVRRLFQVSDTEFTLGPSFDAQTPIAFTLRFQKDGGRIDGFALKSADGTEAIAEKALTREEEISFQQGDAKLAGTLLLPEGPGPHPAIVLLHGSGPLTRYSFGPYRRFYNSLGFAVLTYDKRGTGASTGRLLDASTGAPQTLWRAKYPDDIAADARAALHFLRSRADIDAKRIGLWGSSEGGMLATQVAAREKSVAFAINSSGFMGPLWKTLLYQGGAMMRAGGASEADIEEAMAFNRFWMDVARTGKGYDEFLKQRDSINQRGKPWMFYYAGAYSSLEQMRWSWDHILSFDSLPALRRVKCPVLGVFGQDDVLTNAVEASQAIRAALTLADNKRVQTEIFAHASHSLMETPSRRGMAPGVFDTLRAWVLAQTQA